MNHLDFIRNLTCAICGDDTTVEAAHIRFSDPRVAKTEAGMGRKSEDYDTISLCGKHHRIQHSMGERKFWMRFEYDPIFVSRALYAVSGNLEKGEKILAHWRPTHDSSSLGFSGQKRNTPYR